MKFLVFYSRQFYLSVFTASMNKIVAYQDSKYSKHEAYDSTVREFFGSPIELLLHQNFAELPALSLS